MKPVQSSYATQAEWVVAVAEWMAQDPTLENCKQFMIFEHGPATVDNFMFDGTMLDFAEIYFSAHTWAEVTAFAVRYNHTLLVEGTPEFDEMFILLDDAGPDWEDSYDGDGNPAMNGFYDAGGHPRAEAWADFADLLRDQRKYGD